MGQVSWYRVLGNTGHDTFEEVLQTQNGAILATGAYFGAPPNFNHGLGVLLTPQGDTIWSRRVVSGATARFNAACETHDNGFVLTGLRQLQGSPAFPFTCKFSASGDLLWSNEIATTYGGRAHSILATPDTGCVIAAARETSTGNGNMRLHLVKLDREGGLDWARSFTLPGLGPNAFVHPDRVLATQDKGFLIGGWMLLGNAIAHDVVLVKTDSIGHFEWMRSYGTPGADYSHDMFLAENGDILVCGYSVYATGFVMRIGSTGMLLWSRSYTHSGNLDLRSIVRSDGGGFVLTGTIGWVNQDPDYEYDILLMECDASGDVLWAEQLATPLPEWPSQVRSALDGSLLLCGTVESSQFDNDAVLYNLPASPLDGCDATAVTISSGYLEHHSIAHQLVESNIGQSVTIFPEIKRGIPLVDQCNTVLQGVAEKSPGALRLIPNPATKYIVMDCSECGSERQILGIYNGFGEREMSVNGHLLGRSVDITQLSGGVHFAQLECRGRLYTARFVVL